MTTFGTGAYIAQWTASYILQSNVYQNIVLDISKKINICVYSKQFLFYAWTARINWDVKKMYTHLNANNIIFKMQSCNFFNNWKQCMHSCWCFVAYNINLSVWNFPHGQIAVCEILNMVKFVVSFGTIWKKIKSKTLKELYCFFSNFYDLILCLTL